MSQGFIELLRVSNTPFGMFGVLKLNQEPFCVTLEPQSQDNQKNVSCIPASQYICGRHTSQKHHNTWIVKNVPGRSGILFHSGMVVAHTEGCVLLAEHFGKLNGDLAVLNSGVTFSKFMAETINYKSLHLTIREVF